MESDKSFSKYKNGLLRARGFGLAILTGTVVTCTLDAANIGNIGSFDLSPEYYAPFIIAGLTMAVSTTGELRRLRQSKHSEADS